MAPDGTPAPKTAFWITSFVSTAIRSAWRTRLSSNGLRDTLNGWVVSQADGLWRTWMPGWPLSCSAPWASRAAYWIWPLRSAAIRAFWSSMILNVMPSSFGRPLSQ